LGARADRMPALQAVRSVRSRAQGRKRIGRITIGFS
jgi:hypothetical protein